LNAARDTLSNRSRQYLKEPIVSLHLLNFTVSVLGEVNKPDFWGMLVALMISVFLSLLPKRKNMVLVTANEASAQPNTSITASREQIDQEEAQEKANTLSHSH